ncbi:uncharacterized protein CANTADRAFT_22875 [Suhomyces tanzawaensis NRRL Y-17324]|uniref:Uncharacterized protein n=1 Tax=Suhomyces tanzawaensis NRRL Y-17324 TaxID=984487 RepID=A0A1E4SE03_9ASCO|nr:uncharacterized protein CANTADRAFT_22875 [Suhomyces tanzawaensis NRRL Y-17324]ODV77751.1 hypothetical protein CANTADRAFT_22875 [Suhomyces tanzawaensis NRRL Y-17324]
MAKTRKPQSDQEYAAQRDLFHSKGPQLNTQDWLLERVLQDADSIDPETKTDRVVLLQACEKAYYQQDYELCLVLVRKAEAILGVEPFSEHSLDEDIQKKVKKTAKLERHVVELHKLEERCLHRLKESA